MGGTGRSESVIPRREQEGGCRYHPEIRGKRALGISASWTSGFGVSCDKETLEASSAKAI